MIGSSSTGLGLLERLLHRLDAGQLEGDLRGVDGVVLAVEQAHAHALDRVAGERRPLSIASRTPFSTAGMNELGITPPLILSTNS